MDHRHWFALHPIHPHVHFSALPAVQASAFMSIFRVKSLDSDPPAKSRPSTPPSLKANFRDFMKLSKEKLRGDEHRRPRVRRMSFESLEPLESFLSKANTQKEQGELTRTPSNRSGPS